MIRKILAAMLLLIAYLFAVFAQDMRPPTIQISLSRDNYQEGTLIEGFIELGIKGVFSSATIINGAIGNVSTKRKLADALEEAEIEYGTSQGGLVASEPTSAKTFSFASAGKSYLYLKLPKSSEVQDFEMDVKGLGNVGSFPLYPSLDIGDDNRKEWKFAGTLVNFSSFILPNGLQEQNEAGVVYVMNREDYFCEVANLSDAKEFEIYAKYAYGDNINGANLSAVILSYSGSGNIIQAQGGANSCAMPEATNDLEYRKCNVRFSNSIKGEYLACVYNKNHGNGNLQQYRLAKDNAPGSGYRCNRIQNGQTSCERQVADFFIKVKAGSYDGYLRRQANIDEGKTEYVVENELRNYLAGCNLIDSVNCLVPVSVESKSAGILYVDNLKVKYRSRGSQFIESFFYDASGSIGYFTMIDGNSLSNVTNITVRIPISVIGLVAPLVDQDKNVSISIGLEPGGSIQKSVRVTKVYGVNASVSVKDNIDSYKSLIESILERHGALFDALGNKKTISDAIDELEVLSGRARSVANSNKSASEKTSEGNAIMNAANTLIRTLPRGVVAIKSVSDIITPSYDDVSIEMLLPEQRTDEGRRKVYELQESVTVNAKAEYLEVTYFNDNKDAGTLITKQVSGAGSGYFVEIIPEGAASVNEIKFSSEPEVISQNPLAARFPSIERVSYFVNKDLTSKLGTMPTIFVPEVLPEEERREPIAVCGDGECTAIKVGEETVWLEDKYSCPADCKPKYPWSVVIVALLLIAAIVFYINLYHGRYSFQQTINKGRTEEKRMKVLFSSTRDEEGIKEYITSSMKKGFDRQGIVNALRTKGWTKEQIEYAFKQLKR